MIGLVHIYTGDGKGKTTAALGLSLRMAGCGGNVLIVQFLKSTLTGELASLALIPAIKILRSEENLGFTFNMNELEKAHARLLQQELFLRSTELISDKKYKMLVLDEIMAACSSGMIDEEQVVEFLKSKPKELEIVMTGRNPPQKLLELADYVSEIKKIKHPFDKGINAREGIEL